MMFPRIAAYFDLLRHYRAVTVHSWQRRHELGGGLFNEQEAEFLPAALSLQEMPVSSTATMTGWLLVLLVTALVCWSVFGKVDIVVNAHGKIIPTGHAKTIASVETASVRAVHVVEGQQVKAGDLLVELDATASDAERDKADESRSQAVLQEARAHGLIDALNHHHLPQWPTLQVLQKLEPSIVSSEAEIERLHLEGQYHDYVARKERIDAQIAHLEETLPLVAQTARDYGELRKSHDISEHAWIEKERARIEIEGQLLDAKKQRESLSADVLREAYDQLTDGAKTAASARQDARRSASHSRLLQLTAPVDGVIQQLTVHTIGGVVQAAQPLMEIVPIEKSVEIEATFDNKDVGFVKEGQPAQVKIAAFDYTKYGTVPASVTHVSRDAVQDEKKGLLYTAKITLLQTTLDIDGQQVALSPGMLADVEIKTGDRRLVDYFLSPLQQHERESLHER
jgi:hemolysin D